jgi:signal transduction histidine kinase
VLQRIVDIARELAGARYAALGVLGGDGGLVDLITSGMSNEQRAALGHFPENHGILGTMLREGHAVRISDINEAPGRSGFPPKHPKMRQLMGVPISTRNAVLGDLYLADKENGADFTNEDERLIVLLANHAGVAIQNARLHEQVQRIASLEERDRIGQELHDGTIQSLYAVGLTLEDAQDLIAENPDTATKRLDDAIEALGQIVRDLRAYIVNLRPQIGPGIGLREGLEQLAAELRTHTVASVSLSFEGNTSIPSPLAWEVLQLARESFSNITRHAAASRVRVQLKVEDDTVKLDFWDNGRGFDSSARHNTGQGMRNLTDRTANLGGRFRIESKPGQGTSSFFEIPIPVSKETA